jgi:two-component system NtrC family sensor kinase
LASIIEKRRSLHKQVAKQQKENKQLQYQLGQLQALANIGLNTSMIAHELNNLLTPLSNYAALALQNPQDKDLTEKVLHKTALNCQRASKVMQSILAMTRKDAEKKSIFSLRNIVDEIFTCLCRDFSKDRIEVTIDIPQDLTVEAVSVQIQQVLMNLILNAREALLPAGGYMKIGAERKSDGVHISVSDDGCGIEPENLNQIFDAFFTTRKNSGQEDNAGGTGLGLAFCKKVIESHEGTITIQSQPGKGSTFTIILPG